MKPKNIKQFNALIRRYKSIKLEEIEEAWLNAKYKKGHIIANNLTGFHDTSSCSLCIATMNVKTDYNCMKCVYATDEEESCHKGINESTYYEIYGAASPQELLLAFRRRARHMVKTYPQYLLKDK